MTHSPLTRLQKFRLLSLIPLYFMIVGLFLQPIKEILPGLWTLIREPDFLITDYFLVGGIGTSFINAGLLTLLCIWTIYFLDMEMDGHTITSSCLMFGFSLFGKNLKYLGNSSGRIPLFPLSQKTHVQLHLHRFLRHQPVPDHHADHVYHRSALPSAAFYQPRRGPHDRFCAAAVIHPCSLRPQRLLPL